MRVSAGRYNYGGTFRGIGWQAKPHLVVGFCTDIKKGTAMLKQEFKYYWWSGSSPLHLQTLRKKAFEDFKQRFYDSQRRQQKTQQHACAFRRCFWSQQRHLGLPAYMEGVLEKRRFLPKYRFACSTSAECVSCITEGSHSEAKISEPADGIARQAMHMKGI